MTQLASSPPVDQGVFRSLARVLPYAKAELPRLGFGTLVGLLASAFALAIPLTLEALVDGPLQTGNTTLIWGSAGLIALLGLLEALFVYLRRVTVLTPGTRIDAKMRNAIYQHVQDLPVAFHDSWQSGQLLSRAQTDISLVRRWMSFGLVMLVSNSITIILGVRSLFT